MGEVKRTVQVPGILSISIVCWLQTDELLEVIDIFIVIGIYSQQILQPTNNKNFKFYMQVVCCVSLEVFVELSVAR